ncbi:MAG: hypothetical protein WDM76_04365 [Limisphaerales bacterium]
MTNHSLHIVPIHRKLSRPKPNSFLLLSVVLATLISGFALNAQDAPPYKKSKSSCGCARCRFDRTHDAEEKARQLDMYFGCESFLNTNHFVSKTHAKTDAIFDPQLAEKNLGTLGAGSIHDLYPRAKLYNQAKRGLSNPAVSAFPRYSLRKDCTVIWIMMKPFSPQSIGLATTWNPDLARRTGAAIAAQARANGVAMIPWSRLGYRARSAAGDASKKILAKTRILPASSVWPTFKACKAIR